MENEKKHINKVEFAAALEDLAKQIREGAMHTTNGKWDVPDTFDAVFQIKEKKGRMTAKVKWRWPTLSQYSEENRHEVDQWKKSLKSLKVRMGSSFKAVNNAIKNGIYPDEALLKELVDSSQAFANLADPEWETGMTSFLSHLDNLIHAVKTQQFEVVVHELNDLRVGMKECHREYK